MSSISNLEENAVKTYGAEMEKTNSSARKTGNYGKTIGQPKLSDKAAKYYEELKKKFSNMDFILVSADQKEAAKAQAGSFANPYKTVVLVDEEKIEKMAEDEVFRAQYEGIIRKPDQTESDYVTVTASSIDELKKKVDNVLYAAWSDLVRTDEERLWGQNIDFRL